MVAPTIFIACVAGSVANWSLIIFALAWIVTVLHMLLLGLPMFIFLERSGRLKWMPLIAAGFAAGFLPLGVLTCPLWSVGIDGTLSVLFTYAVSCTLFGLLGSITAITLWRIWLGVNGCRSSSAV